MHPQITYDDLIESGIIAEITNDLCRYSVGFTKVNEKAGNEEIKFSGSGTLIHFENHFAILTADHVLQNLNDSKIGILLPSIGPKKPQRIFIEWNKSQVIQIGKATNTQSGPDLALYLLHPIEAERLKNYSIFYNLDKRRNLMLHNLRDINMGGWFLCGAPEEWAKESKLERSFTKVMSFKGFCGAVVVTDERNNDNFDYLDVSVNPKGKYDGPLNYEGVSGGGLWQIILEEKDKKLNIKEYLLSGVAFYQIFENKLPKTIICHGRRSIYRNLYSSL